VEKSATSEAVEVPTRIVVVSEAGDVGAQVTMDSFAATHGTEKSTVKVDVGYMDYP
jgi:hypothetical protein